ncbi:MAG: NADH-quinone oxidoreductase subunit C [Alphaproteobacteria bacterium]
MDQGLRDLGEHIAAALPNEVARFEVSQGELVLVGLRRAIVKIMTFLRDDSNCQFKVLVDIAGVDYPQRDERFEVVYNLLSLKHNQRVRLKVSCDESAPVPSIAVVFSTAGWYEREAWDLYGILFDEHPDLRRILTDYGFEGHPFRKDFPLTGYVEVRYDEEQKRVVYEPVKLTQEFRSFDFLSPWEGMTIDRVLPGDEKATGDDAGEGKS